MACVQSTVTRLQLRCDGPHIRPRRAVFDGASASDARATASAAGWEISPATMSTFCLSCVAEREAFFRLSEAVTESPLIAKSGLVCMSG